MNTKQGKDNVLILTKDFESLKRGCILYRGEFNEEAGAIEYFDMTTEIETGHSYSYFKIQDSSLTAAPDGLANKVNKFLEEGKWIAQRQEVTIGVSGRRNSLTAWALETLHNRRL